MSRVALVTGAVGAIGRAISERLERDGFAVARTDRRDVPFPCDLRSEQEVAALLRRVGEELGAPWLLVNVAGVFFEHRVPELEEERWDEVIDVNLKGTFLTCKHALPAMIEAGSGCIVNVASTAGLRGGSTRAAYCASKGGVVLFTRSLALDHGPEGVRVNCLCPGLVDTPMADWIRLDDERLAEWAEGVPARRIGTPADMASAVSFLASDEATYMHGAVLVVDGGVSA